MHGPCVLFVCKFVSVKDLSLYTYIINKFFCMIFMVIYSLWRIVYSDPSELLQNLLSCLWPDSCILQDSNPSCEGEKTTSTNYISKLNNFVYLIIFKRISSHHRISLEFFVKTNAFHIKSLLHVEHDKHFACLREWWLFKESYQVFL